MTEGAERKEQITSWTAEKKQVSAFATDLLQINNGVVIPPTGWKCHRCEKTENLWLNLTDGMILCGRKNWDGTGGNNHAVEHYYATKYPLAVKLGTIAADLESAGCVSFCLCSFSIIYILSVKYKCQKLLTLRTENPWLVAGYSNTVPLLTCGTNKKS